MKGHKSKFSNKYQLSHQLATPPSLSMLGFALFGCGGLMLGLVCPVVDDYAAAESITTTSGDDTLSISVPTSLQLDLTPTFTGSSFATASGDVSVSTTNAYGYSLYISSDNTDSTGAATTSLINKDDNTKTLPTLSAAVTGVTTSSNDNFTVNTYGFTTNNNGSDSALGQVAANTYLPLTSAENATLIKKTETTASADTTTVTFAAKADATLTPGDYSGNITFTVSANPSPVKYMQDMTATECASLTLEETYEYVDSRDSKVYAIRKLADGNCWMVQNLALDPGTAISSDDTDITSTSTYTLPTSSGGDFSSNNNNAMVTGTHIDGHVPTTTSGSLYSSDLTSTGNWYSWYAATAGTGTASMSTDGEDAESSICPKGWRLPTGANSSNGDEFATLYSAYSSTQASLNAVFPLQLSGTIFADGPFESGTHGYWWSSTVRTSTYVRNLRVTTANMTHSDTNSKNYVFSVRCVSAD